MKEWWKKRKEKSRKYNKRSGDYNPIDFFIDVLIFVPELIIIPFRLFFWIVRGFIKGFLNIFDIF